MDFVTKGASAVIPPIPRWLLVSIYVLYLGTATTASVPLFADIDWLHEGERMGVAQAVLDGGLPIRDVYLPHGFFPEVIRPLLAFLVFGESFAADRLAGLLIQPLAYVAAVFYVWRVFPTLFWRVVGILGVTLYPLLLLPRHIVVFLALGLLTSWVYERNRRYLFGAGLIAGLGSVGSTVDQAVFLLATLLLFPFAMMGEHILLHRRAVLNGSREACTIWAVGVEVATPLWAGVSLGLLPFMVYLGWGGSINIFIEDLVSRAQADAYAFTHAYRYAGFPSMSVTTWIWYLIPSFYIGLLVLIIVRLFRLGDRCWTTIVPTLLFGVCSFAYAIRQPTYWKLAVVSFPFVIAFVFLLSVVTARRQGLSDCLRKTEISLGERVMLGTSGCLLAALLIHSLTREWGVKQVVPRILFPSLALGLLLGVVTTAAGRFRAGRWHDGLVAACPLAALIVSVWFYNDAKPQLLAAQIKKPRLVSDIYRLVRSTVTAESRLTRNHPVYVDDEVLDYMKTLPPMHKRVVILASGAGVYYFLAGQSPPNRFPGVELAMADAWAQEVVDGLDRTKADILVACNDHGQMVTGWPMKPILSNYIVTHYVDSGVRLNSKMLGADCPFEVWVHRFSLSGVRV